MGHFSPQEEEHYGVECDGAEFGDEDPDVVAPEAGVDVFSAHPALGDWMLVCMDELVLRLG